jgi:protein-disulfide isomerase
MKEHIWKILIGLGIVLIIGFLFYSHYTRPTYPDITSPRPIKGVPNAKVKIVEFSDFQCPACKAATQAVKSLDEKYGYDICIEYKYFPLVSIHQNSFLAAMAAECANDHGKFWDYHDKLFANQNELYESDLIQFAKDLNLDIKSFQVCLDSKAKSGIVRADMAEGASLGINSTPTFFVDGEIVDNWSLLEGIVKEKLGKKLGKIR